MSFEREFPEVRYVETNRGDTLQKIALRELGDASSWSELALINGLRYPYLTDEPSLLRDGVLLTGSTIAVPSAVAVAVASSDPDKVYLRDLRLLPSGQLKAIDGDIALVGGIENLSQALLMRVRVVKRDLAFHTSYGCWVSTLIGNVAGPTAAQLAAFYVKSSLLEDERVQSVSSCTATVTGDRIDVDAVVVPISGRPIDLSIII